MAPAQRAAAASAALDAASKPGGSAPGLADQIDRLGGFADGSDNPVALHSRKCARPKSLRYPDRMLTCSHAGDCCPKTARTLEMKACRLSGTLLSLK